MRKLTTLLLAVAVLSFTSVGMAGLFGPDSIEGTVSDIGANFLVIAKKSPAGHQITQVSLQVNQETQYDTIASLNDLSKGDEVKVEYTQEDNQKIALKIAKLESVEDAEAEINM